MTSPLLNKSLISSIEGRSLSPSFLRRYEKTKTIFLSYNTSNENDIVIQRINWLEKLLKSKGFTIFHHNVSFEMFLNK